MIEQLNDEELNIKTSGDQKGFNRSFHYYRYEPSPYFALKQLFRHNELDSQARIVDFGCGKGRLSFVAHYLFNATVVGVEMNELFYKEAVENRLAYGKKSSKRIENIHFQCCLAEEYEVAAEDNRFYFFNPFSVQIFMKVINNILLSLEKSERNIELLLYYPSEDYIYFLENHSSFELKKEILLPNLTQHNPNERFLIYQIAK